MDCVISCKLSLHTILKSYKFNSCKFISLKLLMEHSKTLKCKHACLKMIDFFFTRAPVTKLSYFVEKSSGLPVYPSVTKPPVYDSLATSVGVRLFTGKSSLRYSDCFRLYVGLPQWTVDRSSVKKALTQVWTTHSPGKETENVN